MEDNSQWHLDKRIPITLIFAIILQTAMFVWFLSGLSEAVNNNSDRIAQIEISQKARQEQINNNTVAVAVINENLRGVKAALERIEKKLDDR